MEKLFDLPKHEHSKLAAEPRPYTRSSEHYPVGFLLLFTRESFAGSLTPLTRQYCAVLCAKTQCTGIKRLHLQNETPPPILLYLFGTSK